MTAVGSSGPRERSLSEILSLTDARRFVPESLGLVALIWLARAWLADGSAPYSGMPHPFWIPVLLMSGQYGIMGGLFATLAATAAFFAGELPMQSATQDFYDHARIVAAQPCAWFGTALVLGGLRTLHMHHQADLRERFEQTEAMALDLADGLERAVNEVENLEHRIATDHDTLAALLHGLAKLEVTDRRSLVGSIADVIRFGVGATGFAIYLEAPGGDAASGELEPCVGIEDGALLAPAAIPPLPPGLDYHRDRDEAEVPSAADGRDSGLTPLWAPIAPAGGKPIGVVVCTRLLPSRDPAIARRRLTEVCRVLAVLLVACPIPLCEAAIPLSETAE